MIISSKAMVSMRDANQNFSKVTSLVDKEGVVIISKYNKPKYIVMHIDEDDDISIVTDELIKSLTEQFATKYEEALRELAK